jgi:hypothetical protein
MNVPDARLAVPQQRPVALEANVARIGVPIEPVEARLRLPL